jgi:hypothetical protein
MISLKCSLPICYANANDPALGIDKQQAERLIAGVECLLGKLDGAAKIFVFAFPYHSRNPDGKPPSIPVASHSMPFFLPLRQPV